MISIGQEYNFFAFIRRKTMFKGPNPNEEKIMKNDEITFCSHIQPDSEEIFHEFIP